MLQPSPGPNDPLFAPLDLPSFRLAFLTASTWAKATATPTELAFATSQWHPGQTIAHAIAVLQARRVLDRRGLLRKQEREAREAAAAFDSHS